jgi:microcystin-dependent protein
MSEPFLGEIRQFAMGYAPQGWAPCNGQILPIAQNQALFALLGTVYGGNGQTTFALPDLRGRVGVGAGMDPGLPPVSQGQVGGEETHTLTINELPAHTHMVIASTKPADAVSPNNAVWATTSSPNPYGPAASLTAMSASAIGQAGSSQPHTNLQPFVVVNFCIALQGIFPSRN